MATGLAEYDTSISHDHTPETNAEALAVSGEGDDSKDSSNHREEAESTGSSEEGLAVRAPESAQSENEGVSFEKTGLQPRHLEKFSLDGGDGPDVGAAANGEAIASREGSEAAERSMDADGLEDKHDEAAQDDGSAQDEIFDGTPTHFEDLANPDESAENIATQSPAPSRALLRPPTPSSRTSTPPLTGGFAVPVKKFSSINVNKKFLNKTISPAPGAPPTVGKLGSLNGKVACS